MKVMVPCLVDVRKIEYREQEITLRPDQVLVRHVCSAPSIGTALHMYQGDHLHVDYVRQTRPWPYPWLQGFAYGVGRVEKVGAEVDPETQGLAEGDLVYSMKLTSELSAIHPSDLIPLPKGLDPESAALVYQALVGLNGIREARITLGDVVLVTGQGPIGLFTAQFCKLAGAWKVITSDLSERQLEISRNVGIDLALNARTDDVPQRVRDLTLGRGADVVVEASGSPAALLQCASAARRLAKVVVVGWIMDTFTFNLAEDFVPKGLEMVVCHSGRSGTHRYDEKLRSGVSLAQSEKESKLFIFDLMRTGRLNAAKLISHRYPLKDLVEAWEFIDRERNGYSQVLLVS